MPTTAAADITAVFVGFLASLAWLLAQTLLRTEEALHGQLLAERSGQITPEQFKEIKEVRLSPYCEPWVVLPPPLLCTVNIVIPASGSTEEAAASLSHLLVPVRQRVRVLYGSCSSLCCTRQPPGTCTPYLFHYRHVACRGQVMVFFDKDKDQLLDISEFRSCVTGLGLVMTEEQINSKLAELDSTGDGKLNFDEFAHFMAVQVLASHSHYGDLPGSCGCHDVSREYCWPPNATVPFLSLIQGCLVRARVGIVPLRLRTTKVCAVRVYTFLCSCYADV